jgi:AcrR family transcriptional regulator
MRKKDETLRETLLACARALAENEGIDAINIRSLAQKAGVAIGTVYNYFSNKNDILLALTEEFWSQTLTEMQTAITADSFCGQLEEIFAFLKKRIDRSAGKLMGSLEKVEAAGRQRMISMQADLEKDLIRRMVQDTQIRAGIWDEVFTREAFARFLMMNLILQLRMDAPDILFILAIVRRTLY